jgi:hypothetical protein
MFMTPLEVFSSHLQGEKLFLVFSLVISLWFSLASIRLCSPDHKVALTEECSLFGGLKVAKVPKPAN